MKSENSHNFGIKKRVMKSNMRGSRGRGAYVYLWLIHVDAWWKTTKLYKATILQFKNKLKKKEYALLFTKAYYEVSNIKIRLW